MPPSFLAAPLCALALVGFADAIRAETSSGPPAVNAPPAGAPDACRLVPQSDLEALFPGQPVKSRGPTLSPVYAGPQYNAICAYTVRVPSPTTTSDETKFISITVVQWGKGATGRNGAQDTFKNMRHTRETIAKTPSFHTRIESLPEVGDEAFTDVSDIRSQVDVRKGDLAFVVSLDNYSSQTLPNVIALAKQAASRWREGTGMVEANVPIASNTTVDIPADTRASAQAPVAQWPDACALLPPEDVKAVFDDMIVTPPRTTMGSLTTMSRVKRVEKIPNPIACHYDAHRIVTQNGERKTIVDQIALNVEDMAATPDLATRYYKAARKVGDAKDLDGLGVEASLSTMNSIYLRKGLLNVRVSVNGDARDRALYDDATRRVNELARRVAPRLP